MSVIGQFSSVIKSIQSGLIVMNNNESSISITITSVDTDKSVFSYGGQVGGIIDQFYLGTALLRLTSATTINAFRTDSTVLTKDVKVSYQVIEYF